MAEFVADCPRCRSEFHHDGRDALNSWGRKMSERKHMKLSMIGVVVTITVMPTALSAQMGGAVNAGVHVGGAVNPGATVRGAVERGIPGPDLGTWRSPTGEVHRKRKQTAIKQRR
jgi:hypothetical protein